MPTRFASLFFVAVTSMWGIARRLDLKGRRDYTFEVLWSSSCWEGLDWMSAVLEAVMLVCFGLSWPINAMKAWKAGTAAGTSWMFLALITFGYIAGIAAKFVGGTVNWVLAVYIINLVALIVNWTVFARNKSLDSKRRAARV